MIIDTHHHFIPGSLIDEFKKENNLFKAHIVQRGNTEFIAHEADLYILYLKNFTKSMLN
jgi:hypothetical protein